MNYIFFSKSFTTVESKVQMENSIKYLSSNSSFQFSFVILHTGMFSAAMQITSGPKPSLKIRTAKRHLLELSLETTA